MAIAAENVEMLPAVIAVTVLNDAVNLKDRSRQPRLTESTDAAAKSYDRVPHLL